VFESGDVLLMADDTHFHGTLFMALESKAAKALLKEIMAPGTAPGLEFREQIGAESAVIS
jgi:hypothetical protein